MNVNVLKKDKKYTPVVIKENEDLYRLKQIVRRKLKLEFQIAKFHCIENNIQIDDDDVLKEFINIGKFDTRTLTLVPLKEGYEFESGSIKKKSEPCAHYTYRGVASNIKDEKISSKSSTKMKKEKLVDDFSKMKIESKESLAKSELELKELELKRINLEIRQAKIARLFAELKKAEQVDICFMVDCTGSMQPYINEAKTVVHRVVDKLSNRFKDLMLRCAFVGYRDHCDGGDRVTVLPFTGNKETFKAWVSNLKAIGGGDECEDVFGGLEQVNSLGWTNMTRVLFHIGDAPCHGTRFHMGAQDKNPDGDIRGLDITILLSELSKRHVDYYFAEINNTTLKMIDEFNKVLLANQGRKIKKVKMSSSDDVFESVSSSISSSIMSSKSSIESKYSS